MVDFFNSINYLEPRCPNCSTKLDYGVNTSFNLKHKTHVCVKCETAV